MKKFTRKRETGYVAIITAIIISAVLIQTVIFAGTEGLFLRTNMLDAESKARSRSLSEGCLQKALLSLAQDESYRLDPPGEEIDLGDDNTCRIYSVLDGSSSGTVVIMGQSVVHNSYTNLSLTVNTSDFSTVEFQELPSV